ncbi:hypothetical protein EBL89_03675 [Cereibacter sphaeroides]|uniref:helix-turn-helix transcriptional regulator n=1 Tax=Cereibacter TaxID=1653176 RepID=UPI000C6E154E|nr:MULTISPECIES: hypothetical protein [Cereibacter]AZB54465.1 hypothetical protein EBL89_03675 [Cereibacter sphaeroides]AZB58739.1 hypothetical protein EBL88_03765 [Cereibacter sphaeroides]RIA01367.1 hypothetical protein D1122_01515 [Cereibacter sphaeroides]
MTGLPLFLRSEQVADLIGAASAATFLRERPRLERDTLFPPPLPITRHRRLRWRADEVLAWLDRQGRAQPQPLPAVPAGSNVILLQAARTA